jgi:hypothetical protein
VSIIIAFALTSSDIATACFIKTFFSISRLFNQLFEKSIFSLFTFFSASSITILIIFTDSIGYFQVVVSPDSIVQSAQARTLLYISFTSALVGNGFSIIVSKR